MLEVLGADVARHAPVKGPEGGAQRVLALQLALADGGGQELLVVDDAVAVAVGVGHHVLRRRGQAALSADCWRRTVAGG